MKNAVMPSHNRNISKFFAPVASAGSRWLRSLNSQWTQFEGLVASLLSQNGSRTRCWQALHSPAILPPSRRPTGTPRLDLQCPTPWDKNVSVRLGSGALTVSQRASCFVLGCCSLRTHQTRQLHLFLILFLFCSPSVHADHTFYLLWSLLFLLPLENQIITRFSCPLAHRHGV